MDELIEMVLKADAAELLRIVDAISEVIASRSSAQQQPHHQRET